MFLHGLPSFLFNLLPTTHLSCTFYNFRCQTMHSLLHSLLDPFISANMPSSTFQLLAFTLYHSFCCCSFNLLTGFKLKESFVPSFTICLILSPSFVVYSILAHALFLLHLLILAFFSPLHSKS